MIHCFFKQYLYDVRRCYKVAAEFNLFNVTAVTFENMNIVIFSNLPKVIELNRL